MSKIKTRETVRDIKVFDRAANAGKHMKNAIVKSKGAVETVDKQTERTRDTGTDSPSGYATGQMTGGAKNTAERMVNGLRKNPIKKVSGNISKAKGNIREVKRQIGNIKKAVKEPTAGQPQKEMTKRAQQDTAKRTALRVRHTHMSEEKAIRIAEQPKAIKPPTAYGEERTIKTAFKTVKSKEKAARKNIKTAERTSKATVKTTRRTVSVTRRKAEAVRATAKTANIARATNAARTARAVKATVQASRAAAKAAVRTTRIAIKVTIATVKAIIAAAKALISIIAAGGWIAVVVILIICMIAMLLGSPAGIFFSGEDPGVGSNYTMPMAIAEINQEYAAKVKEIRDNNTHDEVRMSGSRASWKEILAVYAVKVSTDPANAQDVATIDESKKGLLRSVFWDMNTLSHRTETKEVTEVIVEDDGNEDFTSTEQIVTKTILYITISHKTATEMAVQYGFSDRQKSQLAELLSDEYADLWGAVLYGIPSGSDDIVAVAISQIGNIGGQPYWSWYGFESRVSWCATFVSWCANQCGYIDVGVIPKFAACQAQGIPWFKDRGLWQGPGYVPVPGDIIFFDWQGDGHSDHVGIVEYVKGDVVHTVEGNTSNSVARRSYRIDSSSICGYGTLCV
jgi:hypothetical protein